MPAGMIDWLTLRFDSSRLPKNVRDMFLAMTGRLIKIDSDGNLEWECSSRESIRSDSHQINCRFGSYLEISGSPARVVSADNVFGSLDICSCARSMIVFVAKYYSVILPSDLSLWDCTRIDITRNYDLGSKSQVLEAVNSFKHVKVGRQKPTSHDTGCGWGYRSSLHMGKIYAKGIHLRKLVSQNKAICTSEQLNKADRLLRLEYSVRRHLLRRIKDKMSLRWNQFTPEYLIELHDQYFSHFISDIEIVDMDTILEKLLANVGKDKNHIPTQAQAKAAYDCYIRIRMTGGSNAKSTFTERTWYRHLKNLRSIGIGDADLQHINVVPLKRRQIVLDNPVSCWDDIKLVEGM